MRRLSSTQMQELSHAYLKVRIFVFVDTGWHKHGPALHVPSVQLQGFRDWHWGFKLYITVASEASFTSKDRANLLDWTTGLKQRPEFRLWLLQGVRQIADEHAAVVISKLRVVFVLPVGRRSCCCCSLWGFFSSRRSRLISRGRGLSKESSLCLHVLICGLVSVSSVPFRTLLCHRETKS